MNKNVVNELPQFVLCVEKSNKVRAKICVEIKNCCLKIEGQDFGPVVEERWGTDEYEYFYNFDEVNTAKLIKLLVKQEYGDDINADYAVVFKNLLLEKYSDLKGCKRLCDFCKANGIEYKFYNWF